MKCNHLVEWGWGGLRVVVEGRMKGRGDAEKRVTGTQRFRSSEGELEGRGFGAWEATGMGLELIGSFLCEYLRSFKIPPFPSTHPPFA